MLFRKLTGEELYYAQNIWAVSTIPTDWTGKEHRPASCDARGRGCPTHCPECKKRLKRMYVPGWKRGKHKPLIRVHAAQIFHCEKCNIFWSTSMLKIEACGYRCRYDSPNVDTK